MLKHYKVSLSVTNDRIRTLYSFIHHFNHNVGVRLPVRTPLPGYYQVCTSVRAINIMKPFSCVFVTLFYNHYLYYVYTSIASTPSTRIHQHSVKEKYTSQIFVAEGLGYTCTRMYS